MATSDLAELIRRAKQLDASGYSEREIFVKLLPHVKALKPTWSLASNAMSAVRSRPNRVIAFSELTFVELKSNDQQKRLKALAPGFASLWQSEYVLVEDFTVLFHINGQLHSTTVPKGFIANVVTGAPLLDSEDPKSWWVHDWHYGKHLTNPRHQFFVVNKPGVPLAVAPPMALTRDEFDSIFEPNYVRIALGLVGLAFGNHFFDAAGAATTWIVPELATGHKPSQVTKLPSRGLAPFVTPQGELAYYVAAGSSAL